MANSSGYSWLPSNAEEYRRWWSEHYPHISYGLCICGCATPTKTPSKTSRPWLRFRGEPQRYINGHQHRTVAGNYLMQDRGYDTECWIWQGYIDAKGYGHGMIARRAGMAHRRFYEREHGALNEAAQLHHLCKQKACVRPSHMQPVNAVEHAQLHPERRGMGFAKAEQIRSLYASNQYTQRELARKLGLHQVTISQIVLYKNWKKP